jgi:hypothetical protein
VPREQSRQKLRSLAPTRGWVVGAVGARKWVDGCILITEVAERAEIVRVGTRCEVGRVSQNPTGHGLREHVLKSRVAACKCKQGRLGDSKTELVWQRRA